MIQNTTEKRKQNLYSNCLNINNRKKILNIALLVCRATMAFLSGSFSFRFRCFVFYNTTCMVSNSNYSQLWKYWNSSTVVKILLFSLYIEYILIWDQKMIMTW